MKVHMEGNTDGNAAVAGSARRVDGYRVFSRQDNEHVTMINNKVRQTLGSRDRSVTTGQLTVSDIVITGSRCADQRSQFFLGAIMWRRTIKARAQVVRRSNRYPLVGALTSTFDGNAPWLYYQIVVRRGGQTVQLWWVKTRCGDAATQTAGTAGADITNFGGVQLTATPVVNS